MYNSHFGFREKPFKLVPNPDFLYLSKVHEIALAHLTYAVSQGDGFVVITGEVGTGKTTLCRIFLERLDENVESAYIFNPKLDSVQLLATVCNEFGIRTNYNNLKQLLDVINGYLIMKNKEDRQVVLLIDEAQNLSIENLEMVRMLSNLETTRSKLLQIILVGQPELGDKLDSYELRQLAQRISLSTHLTPLGADETEGYIQHRVNIAAQRQVSLFTHGACRQIHRFSNGIPRMINIASDRALLTAYSLNRPKVTVAIAKIAIQELASRGRVRRRPVIKNVAIWSAAILGALIISGVVYSKIDLNRFYRPPGTEPTHMQGDTKAPVSLDASPPPAMPARTFKIRDSLDPDPSMVGGSVSSTGTDAVTERSVTAQSSKEALAEAIQTLDHQTSRLDAVARILKSWQQPAPNAAQLPTLVDDFKYFDIAAHQYGLRMYIVRSDLVLVKQLNLPAMIALKTSRPGEVVYMTMIGWDSGQIALAPGGDHKPIHTDLDTLLSHMYGPVYIFWKNALKVDGIIADGSPVRAIREVKNLLLRLGYNQIDRSPDFDSGTQQSIRDFQMRHNLVPDGLVGPLTKIFLIKEAQLANCPQLNIN